MAGYGIANGDSLPTAVRSGPEFVLGVAAGMSPNAINTCKHQEKPVVRFMLRDFENAAVDYPPFVSNPATCFTGDSGL